MRVNAFEPTREEIGDPMAALARVAAFRKQMYAQPKPTESPKPQTKIIQTKRYVPPSPPSPPKIEFDKLVMAEIDRRVAELIENQQLILRRKLEQEIRSEMAGRLQELREEMAEKLGKQIKMVDITKTVCRQFQISLTDIYSKRRTENVVWPRQIVMWYCKTYTLHSLPEIGRFFGGRDHTTVLHAVRKVSAAIEKGEFVALTKDELIQKIQDFEFPLDRALSVENAG